MKSPDSVGIFCLTEAEDCDRMWSEYADASRGFAIAFEPQCRAFDQLRTPGRFGKVAYNDDPVGTYLSLALTGELGGAAAMFFRKRETPYSFEKEWRSIRMLKALEKSGDCFFSRFDPLCIRQFRTRPACVVQSELRHFIESDERYRHVEFVQLP